MSLTITIPDDLMKKVVTIIDECGFLSAEDFVSAAIEQKLLEFKKDKFYRLTDEIREGIEGRGYTVKEVRPH